MEPLLYLFCIGLFIWILNLNSTISDLKHNVRYLLSITKSMQNKTIKNVSKTDSIQTKNKDDFSLNESTDNIIQKSQKIKKEVYEKKSEFHLEEFLGKKFFAILGITSLVCSIGFFTTWAFSGNLIGPTGRIAIGILFSLIILGIGEYLRPKYPKFSPIILSAGIAGLIITTFVAQNMYGFLTANQSFVAYIAEVATGLFLALKNNSRILGNFSIIGALLSPILIQSPETNAIGLLTFLSVLSVAGFVISTQKKWPEIIGILFLGITAFEIGIAYDKLLENSPFIFLSFIFGLHLLLGSGGIIRCIREKIQNKFSKISGTDVFDVLLFIVSILTANFLAGNIFEEQEWKHFGFFVLSQGFLLWGLSEYLKSQKIEIFQKLTLGATMVSIIFATVWEIQTDNEVVLTTLLSIEGILFCLAGKNLGEKLFEFFGRFAIILALIFFINLGNIEFLSISMITLILIIAFIYSCNFSSKNKQNFVWNGFSGLVVSGLILFWNFDIFDNEISNKFEFSLYIIPLIWSLLLSYSLVKTKKLSGSFLGILFLVLVNFIAFDSYDNSRIDMSNSILLILILASNFTALTAFFVKDEVLKISKNIQKSMTILLLGISTLSVFIFSINMFEEPFLTIFWLVWGSLLFALGNKNNWNHFRYFGIAIFCFLIAKLYLVDVWILDTWIRFLAFFTLAIVLLTVSFLYQKKDNHK